MFDSCSHASIRCKYMFTWPQEIAEILNRPNRRGKSVKDAASYNKLCSGVVKKYRGEHCSEAPGDWQAPLPDKHVWQRAWWNSTPSGQDDKGGQGKGKASDPWQSSQQSSDPWKRGSDWSGAGSSWDGPSGQQQQQQAAPQFGKQKEAARAEVEQKQQSQQESQGQQQSQGQEGKQQSEGQPGGKQQTQTNPFVAPRGRDPQPRAKPTAEGGEPAGGST